LLTARRESVLNAIVEGHIDTVTPVGSRHIARKWGRTLSPATVRSEMAALEQEGYITRPHTSAGGLPTDLGYRTYVRQFLANPTLGPKERSRVRQSLVHVAMDQEGWARSAAEALSRLTGSLAVTTVPKPSQVRLKHIELVPVQDLMVMTLVVLWGAKILRQMISLERNVPSSELTRVSNKLNHLFEGVAPSDLEDPAAELSPLEENVVRLLKGLMEEEEQRDLEDPLVEGLQQLFEQPELAEAEILRDMLEILEEKDRLKSIMEQVHSGPGIRVAIGGEVRVSRMRHFSLIVSEYGISDQAKGVIGVFGPKRMAYRHNIPAVNYLAHLMSDAVQESFPR
jgi:heat-inducible transcriptional repressor